MDDNSFKQLWQTSTEKLEKNFSVSRDSVEEITQMKVKTFLSSMKPIKLFAVVVGILWVGFVDMLIINLFHIASPFFLISALIQVVLTKLAIGIYLYQLILIHQVDISEPIISSQKRLANLKSSTLWVARLLFLQLPVWTTFYWNESMLQNGNLFLFTIQGIVTTSFTVLAIWLFANIKYENREKKWFRLLFGGKEWQPVIKSIEFLSQIEGYSSDENRNAST